MTGGKTIEQVVNEAIAAKLERRKPVEEGRSLRELEPRHHPADNERLSEEVDAVVYGIAEGPVRCAARDDPRARGRYTRPAVPP